MTDPIRSIVAGIAAVDETDPLLTSALDVATRTGARLHLVHAFELPALAWGGYAPSGMIVASALDEYARDLQTRLEDQVRALSPIERFRIEVVAGPPASTILAAVVREEADLVLVGATRRGKLARTFLGTTAQRVLRGTPVPVLVLRDQLPHHLLRVLLATDLSEFSGKIHETSLDVLETLFPGDNPELRVVYVVRQAGDLPFPIERELLSDVADRSLAGFIEHRRARNRSVNSTVRYGDPAKEITAEGEDWRADLLVVGTHGRKGATRWILGSVAEATIRGASSSVLVIPARAEDPNAPPIAP
jgi:nucleotide-binding universal stress UspA family protein